MKISGMTEQAMVSSAFAKLALVIDHLAKLIYASN